MARGHGTKGPATCIPALAFPALLVLNTEAERLLEVLACLPPANLPFSPRQEPWQTATAAGCLTHVL